MSFTDTNPQGGGMGRARRYGAWASEERNWSGDDMAQDPHRGGGGADRAAGDWRRGPRQGWSGPDGGPRHWFARAEGWLDERGRGAWIAAAVLGFILFWPIGLALLAYMIWSKRMFRGSCGRHGGPFAHDRAYARRHGFRTSGNTAFDAYKADTLRRLEEEQKAFEAFLDRLRAAKDKTEFDAFMDERAARAKSAPMPGEGEGDTGGPPPAA